MFLACSTYCQPGVTIFLTFWKVAHQGSPFAEMTQAVGNPLVFGLKRPRDKRLKKRQMAEKSLCRNTALMLDPSPKSIHVLSASLDLDVTFHDSPIDSLLLVVLENNNTSHILLI